MNNRIVSVIIFLVIIFPLKSFSASPKYDVEKLKAIESYSFNIPEISGMCWRTDPISKKRQLVLVGDRTFSLYIIDWEQRKNSQFTEIKLGHLFTSRQSNSSQWESVAADETGRIMILQEHPAQLFVISANLNAIEKTINLEVPTKGFEQVGWPNDLNSQGEGVILLKNGNILIVKEKKPLKILEFGPQHAPAMGYEPNMAIEWSGQFPLPKEDTQTYTLKKYWSLNSLMSDSSGINVDPKGGLYLLGDKDSNIKAIAGNLPKDITHINLGKTWVLPLAAIKPEAMVIDENYRPIVALDQSSTAGKNFFVLSPLQ